MIQRALTRAGVSVVLAVTMAGGHVSAAVPAAAADPAQEAVIQTTPRTTPRAASLQYSENSTRGDGVGSQGVFHTEEGLSGLQWTRFSDGRTFPVARPTDVPTLPTGSDVLAQVNGGRVELRDIAAGSTRSVPIPPEQKYLQTYGSTVVTYAPVTQPDSTVVNVLHLLTPQADGTTRDVTVGGLPDGATLGSPVAADRGAVVFVGRLGDQRRMFVVDEETGRVEGHTAPVADDYSYAVLTPRHLAMYSVSKSTVLVASRTDLAAAPVEAVLPNGRKARHDLSVVGDSLLYRAGSPTGVSLDTVPIDGGAVTTLVPLTASGLATGPGGTAVVVGGTGPSDWAIRRITEDADGKPVVNVAKKLPEVPAGIEGMAIGQGRLAFIDDGRNSDKKGYYRTLGVDSGAISYGERTSLGPDGGFPVSSCAANDPSCAAYHALDGDRFARLSRDEGLDTVYVDAPGSGWAHFSVPKGGRITDAAHGHLIHTTGSTQSVRRADNGRPVLERAPVASALWAGRLWSAGAAKGTVTALDLATDKVVETVATGAPCVPAELQTVGRWLYWSCGPAGMGASGVYDRTAKKSVGVPSGEALLGDGYVVTHDTTAGKLVLTDVHAGGAQSRELGNLPATGFSQRHVRWSVDRFGGLIAYADTEQRIHLIRPGVPASPLVLDRTTVGTAIQAGFSTSLVHGTFSRPVRSWTVTVRDKFSGKTVRTLGGGETRGAVAPMWDGLDEAGRAPVTGTYTWTMEAVPADGQGPALSTGGSVELTGASRWRDYARELDGVADLFTIDTNDGLKVHPGTGTGGIRVNTSYMWDDLTTVVPLGDLGVDGCNDLIGRRTNGELRAYVGSCGFTNNPVGSSTKLGTGWNQFNVLTSPGDLTGDGRPDLVGRQAATGDLYLYENNGAGGIKSRGKIGAKWTAYRAVFGAGDITGDGIGDVLAVDGANSLWRYDGTAAGGLKARALVFGNNWGTGRNAFVGVGDLNKDGKPDLVSRNAAGDLLRNEGTGTGSFRSTVKIGTGWQQYKGIF